MKFGQLKEVSLALTDIENGLLRRGRLNEGLIPYGLTQAEAELFMPAIEKHFGVRFREEKSRTLVSKRFVVEDGPLGELGGAFKFEAEIVITLGYQSDREDEDEEFTVDGTLGFNLYLNGKPITVDDDANDGSHMIVVGEGGKVRFLNL